MEKSRSSLAQIQEAPQKSVTLLVGPPGAGKSTFCHRVVLNSIAADRPIIFVTTERSTDDIITLLRESGLAETTPGAMSFVDAFTETVGLTCTERSDTICANCADLNSISIATTRLQERMGKRGILLAFDSLTSPYLLSGAEVTRFVRLFLSKFAAEGNSVLALVDEGCGKPEDLVGMMSIADAIIKMKMEDDRRLLSVVKHPKVRATKIEVPTELEPVRLRPTWSFDPLMMRQFVQAYFGGDEASWRREVGDFVNLFWPNLAHWSCILWDPKRFPRMIYELNKEDGATTREVAVPSFPWHRRLLLRLLMPKNLSRVRDMKKLASRWMAPRVERNGIMEYLEDVSRTDEHYVRVYESSDCWGFENVGAAVASHLPPYFAGMCIASENGKRDWNAVETKCIGLGDPFCEWKVVPREIDELRDSLEKDILVVERIHDRLMHRLTRFLLEGKPLVERPQLGGDTHLHSVMHLMGFPHVAGERYRMAQRMGGAKAGNEIGQRLMDAGLSEDEAVHRVIDFMNYCKVGKTTLGETIRMRENCESIRTMLFAATEEPSCYFTTGFLNGLFSAVRHQHVREIKCITAGDAYCEWEII
jgi:predicted hydrocarbon binding protein/KaiC/GvpD/RAD55 family RecA-like ATPase